MSDIEANIENVIKTHTELWPREDIIMTRRGGFPHEILEAFIDDLIVTNVMPAREAATLSDEELDVLRANVRSELFYSERVRQLLIERAKKTLSDLRKQG